MKYLWINLTKYVQELCAENYKTLIMKEIKDLNKMERYTILKCHYVLSFTYDVGFDLLKFVKECFPSIFMRDTDV